MKNKAGGRTKVKGRKSLKHQLSAIFIGLMSGMILVCIIFNIFFLEKYYLYEKQNTLKEVYNYILSCNQQGTIGSQEFTVEMRRLCSIYNISFIVTDASSRTLYTSINDEEQFNLMLRDTIFSRNEGLMEVMAVEEGYSIGTYRDRATRMDYLSMWGNLDADNFFMMRTAIEGIRESARISNGMMGMVGLVTLIIAGILVWKVSNRITRPIMELADISREMTELKFERKYEPRGNNEITLLGENINELSEKLESTIRELKTANLELEKDVEARKHADERRSEFIGNVSHELKTPIALIQGYAEGLKEGIMDDQESRDYYCDVIMDETHKMNHLVKRLISLNQFESGGELVQMERFDLNDLVVSCIRSFDVVTGEKGIKVFYEEVPGLFVWGDEYQVEEVLRNYFSNAVNHCKGKLEIHVRCRREEEKVHVTVFNTGEPIPEESVDRLWEKFYKVDKARTREYGGSGLGLSIVKAIMESMKQQYGVKNFEDGVEFWFELPTK